MGPAVLGLLLAGGQAEVVSARLNLRDGTIDVRGVCKFLGSVSLQQKFKAMNRPALQPSDGPMSQLHGTAQFYLESKGMRHYLRPEGMLTRKVQREERPQPNFGSSF